MMRSLRPVHLSYVPPILVAFGINCLPLAVCAATGGTWVFWLDPRAWNVVGHPIFGWRGWRLFMIDILIHWLPLAICIWWMMTDVRKSPALWTALIAVIYVAYLRFAEHMNVKEAYRIERGDLLLTVGAAGLVAGLVVSMKNDKDVLGYTVTSFY